MTKPCPHKALFRAIETALAEGHAPPGVHVDANRGEQSALRVAVDRLGIPRGSAGGALNRAIRALGREPDWSAYRKPEKLAPVVRVSRRADAPISESVDKQHFDWTPQQCIDELLRVVNLDLTKVVSRNYFRNEAVCSESTWNRFFGTFEEFKRQAGVILSRPQHRLEKEIAKHASVENYRAMNFDKAGWEDAYLKPAGRRYQTVLAGSDIHDVDCSPFWRFLFIDTARRVQPNKVILNGDVFDLPEFGKYTTDPRDWDVVGRIKWVHEFLSDLREATPDAEIILVEGNHEFRLLRHLADESTALRAVLADLHGMTVASLLGLDKYEINFVARMDLAAFTARDILAELKRNYYVSYECLLAHHFPEGRALGMPGFNGHHHKHIVWPNFSPTYSSFEWHQLGCGHARGATYCDGEKWGNGFLLAHIDTERKLVQNEYIEVRDGATVIGGRWYTPESCGLAA